MLIGGGSLAVLGGMVLMAEAITTVGRDPERETALVYHLRRGLLVGGFLVALSTFQASSTSASRSSGSCCTRF